MTEPTLERFDLMCVVKWLEAGCDPKEAAKELRGYQPKLAALLSRLDKAEAGWQVRPLQWVEVSPGSWMAHGIGLDYVVCDRQWWQGTGAATPCSDDDVAKAAAQADYEQRIRSALLPPPPSSES